MDTDTTTPESQLMTVGPSFAHSPQGLQLFADRTSFELGQRMAMMLSNSSIIPDTYRRNFWDNEAKEWKENADAVGNCFIALELAQRLGTSPLVVMQQVDMIHGRPALRGTFLIALVNGSGKFTDLEFECNNLTGDAYGYRATATNLGTGKVCVGPWITWTMVKGEKWDSKTGSKWKTMPELMFQYRAAAFWSRLFASHITLGLYETEEARDIEGEYTVIDSGSGKVSRTALLNARSEPEPGQTTAKPEKAARRRQQRDPATIEQGSSEEAATELPGQPIEGDAPADPPRTGEPLQGVPVDGDAALDERDNEAELAAANATEAATQECKPEPEPEAAPAPMRTARKTASADAFNLE